MAPLNRKGSPARSPGRGATLMALALAISSCSGARRPDVLLVVVDTLRADRMSCYGYPRPTTPFVDRLAAEGALFEDVTAQFSWTVPSMVSMFTGRYLTDLAEQVGPGESTLAEAFQRAGYVTVGASANLLLQADTGLLSGFDSFDAMPEDDPGERSLTELGESAISAATRLAGLPGGNSRRAPVFMYLHAFEPHDPYRRLPGADAELPTGKAMSTQPVGWRPGRLAELEQLAPPRDPLWERELDWIGRARGRYDHELRSIDEQLENLFDSLRELGLLEHAIVALVSDHGEGLWDHEPPEWIRARAIETPDFHQRLPREVFYQKHGAIQFQEVLATPMLIWGTDIPAGTRIATAVENIDLLPTLLELAKLPIAAELHGRSLVPHLRGERVRPRRHVFSLGVQGATVRELSSGLKLIIPQRKSATLGEPLQLFHLPDDPHERENLAPTQPADVQRLLAVFEEWRTEFPVNRGPRTGSRAAERTAAMRKRLSALGYSGEESTGEEQ